MKAKAVGRRRFLKETALAGLAMGAARSASGQTGGPKTPASGSEEVRAYGVRSRFEKSVRVTAKGRYNNFGKFSLAGDGDMTRLSPLQDSKGIITASSLNHFEGHGYLPPDIDPQQHRLTIHGMVDRPRIYTLDELERLPSVSRIHFIECRINSNPLGVGETRDTTVQRTHGKMGCAEYTGVLLSVLLQEAGVKKGAGWVLAEGAENAKMMMSIPLEKAMDDCIVAYGQNGEALRPEQGYPIRLVVPGWEGVRNVKWLRRFKVADQPNMSLYETVSYTSMRQGGIARWFEPEMGPKSVITFPSGLQRLPSPGYYQITGLAWSGAGLVRRVEVSTDGGRTWKDAQLQEPVLRKAHTRFRFDWNWNGEEAILQSRCTDERGNVQPSLAEVSKLFGVDLDFWKPSQPIGSGHFNAIEPWKVTRDGSVHNALL